MSFSLNARKRPELNARLSAGVKTVVCQHAPTSNTQKTETTSEAHFPGETIQHHKIQKKLEIAVSVPGNHSEELHSSGTQRISLSLKSSFKEKHPYTGEAQA